MKRLLAFGTLAACVLGVVGAAGQDQPVFRAGSDLVRVFVTVTDRDGRLATTLTEDDFEVRDQGKPQPIALFDNSPQPIRLLVMIDVSTSMEGNLPLLREAAEQLFVRLRPDDLARVGTFGNEVTISPAFTRDLDELRAALPTDIADDALTSLWRGMDEAIETLGDDEDGITRRVVLVLSDGRDGPPLGARVFSQGEVIDRARAEDVMIYAIGLPSRQQRRQPIVGAGGLRGALLADLPDPGLARTAEETGGGYTEIRYGQDLGAALAQVADELHSQYLIGYAPPKRDGKVHKIEVRVSQEGMKPRARKSYVAPKD